METTIINFFDNHSLVSFKGKELSYIFQCVECLAFALSYLLLGKHRFRVCGNQCQTYSMNSINFMHYQSASTTSNILPNMRGPLGLVVYNTGGHLIHSQCSTQGAMT